MFLGVALAATLTWLIPAGEYDRRDDSATGRRVVVAGTYHPVPPAPVTPFGAVVAVPRGIVAGADVVATILFVGAAFFLLDRVGALGRLLEALLRRLRRRGLVALPVLACCFAAMGALENMQEEIIALVPALLVFGRRLGVSPLVMVAASAGSAIVGSAFGPTNPFQAGIALTLAELPPLAGGGFRLAMFVVGVGLWIVWLLRLARRERIPVEDAEPTDSDASMGRDLLMLAAALLPLAAYVYGAIAWGWGFNELSGVFLAGGLAIGLLARLGLTGTVTALLEGMQAILPAGLLVGTARGISVVLADARVIDTILHAMAAPLALVPAAASAVLMVPFHALLHVPVSSVSGQAALAMPVLVPLSDLIGLSRQVTVLAFQVGGGLCELLTPTNGALLAVLLAAGVPYQRWLRVAVGAWALMTAVGVGAILMAVGMGL